MSRIPPISEDRMLDAEAQFPELAARAGRAAHERALKSTGRVVMKKAGRASTSELVELRADGSVRIIKTLPADTPVQPGLVLKRKKTTSTHGGR
jgi:hypothetical protein